MKINTIVEHKKVAQYILEHNLLSQYKKSKQYLLDWLLKSIYFKLREPKSKWIYQFRINNKYRAFWYMDNNTFIVSKISDHQD